MAKAKKSEPVDDIVSKLGLNLEPREQLGDLDRLLMTLRKHGVAKFTRGASVIEFAHGPSQHETREMMRELEAKLPSTLPPIPEPVPDAPKSVDPTQLDLEDILPAGVQ